MQNYESLVDAMDDLRKRGYEADFEPQSDCLYCSNLDLRLNEEEFHIDEVYHFEGDSRTGDNAVVYALTAPGGVKGTIVDGYGASSESTGVDMIKKLQNHPTIASG
ncbi:hypothetical protein [Flavitalea sp.]|nr:hypothetical protein [Flavitalea sp.]